MNIPSEPSSAKSSGLVDRAALTRHRARAARHGFEPFLHELALSEVQDRLSEVNRRFSDIAIVTGAPDFWQTAFPGATVVADDDALALQPLAHDLVIHALALHWSNDPVGQMIQSARALRPDGLFIAAMLGGDTLSELRASLTRAEAAIVSGLSPRVLPMGEIRDLGGLLARSGLALTVADQFPQKTSYRDLFHLAADLRAMGETNALFARARGLSRRDVMLRAAEIYQQDHADPQHPGRIVATFDLVFLTGWAPAENQQKPLRPGSAKMSLAEALASKRTDP